MPAPHALYSKMLAKRTASRNVLVLFYLFIHLALDTRSPRGVSTIAVSTWWHPGGSWASKLST